MADTQSGKSRFSRAKQALDKQKSGPSFSGFQPIESVVLDAPQTPMAQTPMTQTAGLSIRDAQFEAVPTVPATQTPTVLAPTQLAPTQLTPTQLTPQPSFNSAPPDIGAPFLPSAELPTLSLPTLPTPTLPTPTLSTPTIALPTSIPTLPDHTPNWVESVPAALTPSVEVPALSFPELDLPASPRLADEFHAGAQKSLEIASVPDLPSAGLLPPGLSNADLATAPQLQSVAPVPVEIPLPTDLPAAFPSAPTFVPPVPTEVAIAAPLNQALESPRVESTPLPSTTPLDSFGQFDSASIDAVTTPPRSADVTMDELRAMLTGANDRFETAQRATWDPNEVVRSVSEQASESVSESIGAPAAEVQYADYQAFQAAHATQAAQAAQVTPQESSISAAPQQTSVQPSQGLPLGHEPMTGSTQPPFADALAPVVPKVAQTEETGELSKAEKVSKSKKASTKPAKEKKPGLFGRKSKPSAAVVTNPATQDSLDAISEALRSEPSQTPATAALHSDQGQTLSPPVSVTEAVPVAMPSVSLDEFDRVIHPPTENKKKRSSKLASVFAKQDAKTSAVLDTAKSDRNTKLMRIASAGLLLLGLGLMGYTQFLRSDGKPTPLPTSTETVAGMPVSVPVVTGGVSSTGNETPPSPQDATASTPTEEANDDFFTQGEDLAVK